MNKELEPTEMQFQGRLPRIPWTRHRFNKEVLMKNDANIRIRKKLVEIHTMSKEGLGNLTLKGQTEGKRGQKETVGNITKVAWSDCEKTNIVKSYRGGQEVIKI